MAEVVELKGKDGRLLCRLHRSEGLLEPEQIMAARKGRLQKLRELKSKEGDVIIASFPKTGTHWLMDSIAMLRRGKAEVVQKVGFEGFLDAFEDLDKLDQQDGPRLLETHMFPRHLSEDFKQKSKYIVMLRNPKDTAVSMYHMFRKSPLFPSDMSWEEFFEIFFKAEVSPCTFFDFYHEWQSFISSHKDQVLIVYYEEMHKNYEKQLRRLADFIGITISDEIIAAIAKKGNIKSVTDELGKNPKALEFAKRLNSDGKLPFYRKGIVGDWKNHFTVAQSEQADEIIGKGLEGSIFTFDYSI